MRSKSNLSANVTSRGSAFVRALVTFLVVIGLSMVAIKWGPMLVDKIMAMQFQPTAAVSAVNDKIKFTQRGTEVFYASSPTIEAQAAFNDHCQSTERTAAMLGCYYKRKIYLFDIRNKELDGALEVTAAHEMLHAVYDRLGMFERKRVDELIAAEYERVKDNPEIKTLLEYYKEAEPGAESNELHSIIGTTIPSISPALEQYYSEYFVDRAHVVAMNARYTAVFRRVETEAKRLQDEITFERDRLQQDMSSYDADLSKMEQDISDFNTRASSGAFATQSAFNAARTALVARANELSARRDALNERVSAHNSKIEQLKALSVKANELNNSINGVPAPSTSL